jgi:hypothetical protein
MIQQAIVLLVFLAALGYLGIRMWKSLRRPAAGGCAKGCGCASPEQSATTAR